MIFEFGSMNEDLKQRLMPLEQFIEIYPDTFDTLVYGLIDFTSTFIPNPISLRFEPVETKDDDSAYMTYDGKVFEVVIDSRMPFGMVTDFLIHELAHVLSWDSANPKEDHCDEFGMAYAALYREYLKLYEGDC